MFISGGAPARPFFVILTFLVGFVVYSFPAFCESLPGDVDDSGRVDGFDLVEFSLSYGATPGGEKWNERADLDNDGDVDQADLAILRSYFGNTGLAQNVWVIDNIYRVMKLAGKSGKVTVEVDGFDRAVALAASLFDGSCWVVDRDARQIVKLGSDGSELSRVGGFSSPVSASVDSVDGSCWVGDSGAHVVYRLDSDIAATYDVSVDTGSHAVISGFSVAKWVDVDPVQGACWVADGGQVVKVDTDAPDGYNIGSGGNKHKSTSNFGNASFLSVNIVDGSCWVADLSNERVSKLTPFTLIELASVENLRGIRAVSVNSSDGSCWIADGPQGLLKYSSDGRTRLVHFTDPANIRTVRADLLTGGCWMISDEVTDVLRLAADGSILLQIAEISVPAYVAPTPGGDAGQPPTAVALVAPDEVGLGETVTFDGSQSADGDGSIIKYEWDFDGDGTFDFSSASEPVTTHTYDEAGIYNPVLRVTDDDWLTDVDYTSVVRAGALTANAAADPVTGFAPLTVSFSGQGTDPVDGKVLSFQWDFDGDGNYDYFSESAAATTHQYSEAGQYTAVLKVTDTGPTSATDSVSVDVSPSPPQVTAWAADAFMPVPALVELDMNTWDPDGEVVFYEWDFNGDGTYTWSSTDGSKAIHEYTQVGQFLATARVTDDDGLTTTSQVQITIAPQQPVSVATASPTAGAVGITSFSFDGSTSSVVGSTIVSYDWDFGDGTTDTGQTVNHVFNSVGVHEVSLEIRDQDNGFDSTTVAVSVLSSISPVAVAAASPVLGEAPMSVQLSAVGSYDPAKAITTYEWSPEAQGLQDDMEGGTGKWVADEPWALTSSSVHGGTNAWTDSPGGDFASNTDASISSLPIAVGQGGELGFWHRYAFASSSGRGQVEISADGGATWTELVRYTDDQAAWAEATLDISDYLGSVVLIRFRLISGFGTGTDGWYIDDIAVSGDPGSFVDATPSTGEMSHNYTIPGMYAPVLKVTANDGNSDYDAVGVRVKHPPIVTITRPAESGSEFMKGIVFDAVVSDPDGVVVLFEWDFENDGNFDSLSRETALAVHDFDAGGQVTSTIRATDNDGMSTTASVTFTLVESSPRDIVATAAPSKGNVPFLVEFGATVDDRDGQIVKYEWDTDGVAGFDWTNGGPAGEAVSASSTYSDLYIASNLLDADYDTYWLSESGAVKPIDLVFSLESGQTWSVDRVVLEGYKNAGRWPENFEIFIGTSAKQASFTSVGTFQYANTGGRQEFTFAPTSGDLIKLSITSGGVYAEMSEFEAYAGAENILTLPAPRHFVTYDTAATYDVSLRVTDNNGNTGSDVVTVQANEAGSPVATADASPNPTYVDEVIFLNGDATDADGSIVKYEWDLDGDGAFDFTDESAGVLESFTSQFNGDTRAATNLIDGKEGEDKYWASTASVTFPQEFIFSFAGAATNTIDSVAVNNDTVSSENRRVKGFEVLVSTTDMLEGSFSSVGAFMAEKTTEYQRFAFAPASAKYVKLKISSNYGDSYATMAEFAAYDSTTGENLLSVTGKIWHSYDQVGLYPAKVRATDDVGLVDSDTVDILVRPIQDQTERLWMADYGNVYIIDSIGNVVTNITGFTQAHAVATNPVDGTGWVADISADKLYRFSPDVPDGYDVTVDTGSHAAVTWAGMYSPSRMAVNPTDGACWFASRQKSQLIRLDASIPDGYDIDLSTGSHVAVAGFNTIRSVAIDSTNGLIWVTDTSLGGIFAINTNVVDGYDVGADVGSHRFVSGANDGEYIAVNPNDGTVWLGTNSKLFRIAASVPDGYDLSQDSGSHTVIAAIRPSWVSVNPTDGSCWASADRLFFRFDSSGKRILNGFDDGYLVALAPSPDDGSCWAVAGAYLTKYSPNGAELLRTRYYSPLSISLVPGYLAVAEPDVSSTATPQSGDSPLDVAFDVSVVGAKGPPVLYQWDWDGDGTYDWSSPTTGTTNYTYPDSGVYTPVVRVIDDTDYLGHDFSNIIHVGPNDIEVVPDPGEGTASLWVKFAAYVRSSDAATRFQWDFDGNGSIDLDAQENRPFVTAAWGYPKPGTYYATVIVTLASGETLVGGTEIKVNPNPPNASINAQPTSGPRPLAVTLNGGWSGGGGGTITLYEWDFDGDGNYDWSSRTEHTVVHVYDTPGTHNPVLKVSNNQGATDTASVAITVTSKAPVATATADVLEGNAPLTVNFDGSTSQDPDGTIASHDWIITGGATYNGVTAQHVFTGAGSYTATLTVTDNDGDTGQDVLTIVVKQAGSPTATAAAVPTSGATPLNVVFTGTGTDPNGVIVLYEWDFEGDGTYDWNSAVSGSASYTYTSNGSFDVTLRVTDDEGLTDTDIVPVVVGSPPVPIPNGYPVEGDPPLFVLFRTSGEDEDGTIWKYEWDFEGDGTYDWTSPVSFHASHTYEVPGTFDATLRATDNDGLQGVATLSITVNDHADPPEADASADPVTGPAPLDVTFYGAGIDANGKIVLYEWDWESDGTYDWSSPSSGTVAHRYTASGVHTATLRITDDNANKATDSVIVRVENATAPVITNFRVMTGSGNAPFTADFRVTASDEDGTVALYELDFDGDGSYDFESDNPGFWNVKHSYALPGVRVVILRVTDDDGLTAMAWTTVNVTPGVSATRTLELFDPTEAETVTINSVISTPVDYTLRIIGQQGVHVRTLVDNVPRGPGFYSDVWDGKNDAGGTVPSGVYFFIIDYAYGGKSYSFDLTATAGNAWVTPTTVYQQDFSPLDGQPLDIRYELFQPAEVSLYIYNNSFSTLERTVMLRHPQISGQHVESWDGTNDQGDMVTLDVVYYVNVSAWDLPDNALIVSSEPVVSEVAAQPQHFIPAFNPYSDDLTILAVSYRLNRQANVRAVLQAPDNRVIKEYEFTDVPKGVSSLTWDGRDESGTLVAPGFYRVGITATDAGGNKSKTVYVLFTVFY